MFSLQCLLYLLFKLPSMILYVMEGKKKNDINKKDFYQQLIYLLYRRLHLDFELIFESFGNLHIALFIWLIMQLCTAVLVFMGFYYWADNRSFYCENVKRLSKNENQILKLSCFHLKNKK